MDKYEYKLKLDELTELFQLKNYTGAADLADEINWQKVRNAKTLCMVADIYEAVERYDACQEVLMQAYDHSSVGRNIVGRLTDIAIKSKDVQSAEEYYNEFIELAPKDTQGYVFAYKIACLKNAPLADRIAILEEFKEKEYSEMWAYELAVLYAQAGMREKCVETCDELILWFGDGEYVERALDLKRSFQPLTAAQEEKYQKLLSQRGMVEINIPQKTEAAGSAADSTDAGAVPAPDLIVTATKFNTQNLQEEISRSMQQIMDATEENTVRDRLNSIKKIVQDIPYLEGEEEESISKREQIQEEVNEELKSDFQEKLVEETAYGQSTVNSSKSIYAEDTSGMSIEEILADWEKTKAVATEAMAVAEQKKLDLEKEQALAEANDILNRLQELVPILSATPGEDVPSPGNSEGTIADELLSAEPIVLTPAEEREPLIPKEKEEASFLDTIDFATGRLPDINPAARSVKVESLDDWPEAEAAAAGAAAAEAAAETAAAEDLAAAADSSAADFAATTAGAAAAEAAAEAAAAEDLAAAADSSAADFAATAAGAAATEAAEAADIGAALEGAAAEEAAAAADIAATAETAAAADLAAAVEGAAADAAAKAEDNFFDEEEEIDETIGAKTADAAAGAARAAGAEGFAATEKLGGNQFSGAQAASGMDAGAAAATAGAAASAGAAAGAATAGAAAGTATAGAAATAATAGAAATAATAGAAATAGGAAMTDEIKGIFSYFIPIPGMSEQISAALGNTVKYKNGATNSSRGNLVVQGEEGSGKTMLATSLIKAAQKTMGREDDPVAKIGAEALNRRDFASLVPRIDGGYLIIEDAGSLSPDTVAEMSQVMDQNTEGMTVILEDDSAGIRQVLGSNADFAAKFTAKVIIPIFTIDELVDFGKAYALEQECEIEEMAVLALYNRINNIQKVDHPTTLTEVKEIVDAAIQNAEGGGIKKIFAKKYNDQDYLILHEEDFA